MKGAHWSLVVVGIVVALAGCAPAGPTPRSSGSSDSISPTSAAPKSLVVAVKGEPEYFIFDFGSKGFGSVGTADLHLAVHQGLATNDDRGAILPMLATAIPSQENGSWVVRPDGTMKTTYQLRPNITWHDGAALVPDDFVLGWQMVRDAELPISATRSVADLIRRIDAPDANTLVLEWSNTYPFAHALTSSDLSPVPAHLLAETYRTDKERLPDLPYWKREFIGLGPYQLSTWEPGSHLVLKSYRGFFGGQAKIDTITVKFIPSEPTIVANLLAGTVDGVINRSLDFEQAMVVKNEWVKAGRRPVVISQPTHWRMLPFQFRDTRPTELSDVRVRRALVHAIDRQAIVDALLDGQSPVSDTFVTPDDVRWDRVKDVVTRYEYDPRRALELLSEAGWRRAVEGPMTNGAGDPVKFSLESTAVLEHTGTAAAPYWRTLGIDVEQVTLSPGEGSDVRRVVQFPAVQVSNIPLSFQHNLERLHGTRCPSDSNRWTGFNSGCYQNPQNDRIADALKTEIVPTEQTRLWRDVVKLQTEDVPVVPMYFLVVVTIFRDGVTGVKGDTNPRQAATWNVAEWDVRAS